MRFGKVIAGWVLAGAMGGALSLGIYTAFLSPEQPVIKIAHQTEVPVVSSRYTAPMEQLDFTEPAAAVMPAVVHITSTQLRSKSNQQVPDIFKDFFGDNFGQGFEGRQRPSVGSGSGVIISEDGFIVTNNHVIDNADDIEVSLNDNRTYKAEVIGTDPSTDLALLKIEGEALPTLALANSDETKVGQWVLAIGNPFNLNSTVTAGIISAKGRNINILKDQAAIESFIQTDAAVNPGNSGGALVDLNGNLIGINTAIASPTGSYSGYSFAIPSNLMRKVVTDLMEYGTVQRGYLGVMIRSVDGNLAKDNDLTITEGVYIDSLIENSAAEKAGIKKGDVVVGVEGIRVKNAAELQAAIGTKRPGDNVTLNVNRRGEVKDIAVVLKNRNGNTTVAKVEKTDSMGKLGLEIEPLEREEAETAGVRGGVKVTAVNPGIIQKETNLEPGFIITKVDKENIDSVEKFERIMSKKEGGVLIEGRYPDYPKAIYYAFGM
ncbi:MAG: Do family serine endopeptidase [Bacteroidota bacterium]